MDLKQIKSLADQRRYDQALAECEAFIESIPENKADALRTRAYIFALMGDYQRALRDREMIIDMGEGTIRDYYRGADNALSAGKFTQAATWLNEVLRMGEEQNETWFKSASYFLLAYAQMEVRQYQEAIANIDRAVAIEADVAMPLPGISGMCNQRQLREEIMRRQAQR
jgi:tetratricopeptide (TPR) repeat protein